MPEGIPYASSNVIAGVGPDLNYIGNHCYAFSGVITVNNDTVTCLDFKTGAGYIVAEFSQAIDYSNVGNGKFTGFTIKLNDIVIVTNYEATSTGGNAENNMPQFYRLIIPPYTQVTTQGSTDSAANNPFFHTIKGRIYK